MEEKPNPSLLSGLAKEAVCNKQTTNTKYEVSYTQKFKQCKINVKLPAFNPRNIFQLSLYVGWGQE
jgi:hypothetical protein